jgi:hypothetical protein
MSFFDMSCDMAILAAGASKLVTAAALLMLLRPDVAVGSPTFACGVLRGYAYAGAQEARVAHGIQANVVALTRPRVGRGHVAAWVGVGGPGQGRGGSDAWIQIGLNAFSDGISHLYFEVNRPGTGPQYRQLAAQVRVGVRYRLAVLETQSRRGWWRVWLDGAPASAAFFLPGSEEWRPMFTAERWSGDGQACDRFAYRFERVAVAKAAGGTWTPFVAGARFRDPGYRLISAPKSAFVAFSEGRSRTHASTTG